MVIDPLSDVLTADEAAAVLGVSSARVRQLAYMKVLIGVQRSSRWFFSREAVEMAKLRPQKPMGRPPRPGSKYRKRKKKLKEMPEI